MTTVTKTLEVHRIERVGSTDVALYLREVTGDEHAAYGNEHRIVVPLADEKPTGTRFTVTYTLAA